MANPIDSAQEIQTSQAFLGEINITTQVLETIAAKAATEVEGVNKLHVSFQKEVSELLGRESSRSGAKVRRLGDDLIVDVVVHIAYGYSVPQVAQNIQNRVKEQVLFMTDITVAQVNVHVIAIDNDPNKTQTMLHLEDEDGEWSE
ncbi:Asp23/Gls24 family envelope stress response protein [Vaginisenegalia massiliensis]|uniref:Asp23/Gls24 family envelope stress response protein n=1 Tax=Vaginisenegalia massiliensis TaxID=2058294 RepID=UPI000F51D7C9|nr:Asp23/Gls24 family envelope stress response protein [Vaginisenegalia massiliensis]